MAHDRTATLHDRPAIGGQGDAALTEASPEFREWWAEYPVRYFKPATITINHPTAGRSGSRCPAPVAEHPGPLMVIQVPASQADRTRIIALSRYRGDN